MTFDFMFDGLSRKRGDFSFFSQGMPETSCNFKTDLGVVSCDEVDRTVTCPAASLKLQESEVNRTRQKHTRRFLYDFPDPNPAFILNYKFFSALLIISSTV